MKKILTLIFSILLITTIFYTYTKDNCYSKLEILEKTIDGGSMEPMLKNGNKINLMIDYYDICNEEIQKGDIVAYDYGGNKKALIKQIKIVDSDILIFSGGNIIVNGEILSNSVGEKYIFNENEKNMLQLYIKDQKIPKESFFIFGDNINNSIDSRKFGAISKKDVLGKFEF